MGGKKKGYGVLLVITIVFTVAGVATVIPASSASRECVMGYRAFCAYTPVSTATCLILAALACVVRRREFRDR